MISVFVGGRSDGGILSPLIERLGADVIEGKFLNEDSADSVSLGATLTETSVINYLGTRSPRMLVILGDRFEALAAAVAAYNMGIPICHLHGGETTLGSRDDSRRHAITCLSDLHLCSTPLASARVSQIIRDKWKGNIHTIGAMGAWNASTAVPVEEYDIIVSVPAEPDVWDTVCRAMDKFDQDYRILMIGPNQDEGWSKISGTTLEPDYFLSVLAGARVIVGNSSCGIIEAPSARTWTINVGDRQKGRQKANSVFDVGNNYKDIVHTVQHCLDKDFQYIRNPYFAGNSVEKAATAILDYLGG